MRGFITRLMTGRFALHVCTNANNDRGKHKGRDPRGNQAMRLFAGAFPLVKVYAPQGAENNDAGHVQSPTGKAVRAHLDLAHRVKEKLKIPGRPRQSAEKVV